MLLGKIGAGFAHVAVASPRGQQQAVAGRLGFSWHAAIGRLQGGGHRPDLLGRDQGVLVAAEAPQPPGDLGHQLQAGRAAAGAEARDPGAIEGAGGANRRQGGGQQGQVAAEAKPHAAGGPGTATGLVRERVARPSGAGAKGTSLGDGPRPHDPERKTQGQNTRPRTQVGGL